MLESRRICVATGSSKAYFLLVSRLKIAGIKFVSLVPGEDQSRCDLTLTTDAEATRYVGKVMTLEELDSDPFVMKGQILSCLTDGKETLLLGIDPGSRIGMAVFYGDMSLEFVTFDSIQSLDSCVSAFVKRVPSCKSVVRIGNGNPTLALALASQLTEKVHLSVVEIVDESGTSARTVKMKGIQGDQRAAAKIAFRKGAPFD
jgi:hypothetical protein